MYGVKPVSLWKCSCGGNGYYTEAKKTTAASLALKRKLESEGFQKRIICKEKWKT